MIKVRLERDRIGSILAEPVSSILKTRIIKHLREFGVYSDGTVYTQEGYEIPYCFRKHPRYKELDKGVPVVILMDAWTFCHLYGWDTHTLFE